MLPPDAPSAMSVQPPSTVYQTVLDHASRQDTKTPLRMELRVCRATARHLASLRKSDPSLESGVTTVIRRFDLRELEVAVGDAATGQRMAGLRVCQKLFTYALSADGGTLTVDVHRKELPVSKTFGGAAFVFVFYFRSTGEVVTTQPFLVSSKEPREKEGKAKKAPKRVRGPAPRHPVAGDADEAEQAVNDALARAYGASMGSPSLASGDECAEATEFCLKATT